MIQFQQQLSKTSSQKTVECITSFQKRYGEAHLYLAYHASVPLALTPDLLYRLWAEFQWDIKGIALNVPWVAVTDLLFSCLCDEVGSELYEMDEEIRKELLHRFQLDSRFSSPRLQEVSNFLLTYVRPQLDSADIDISDWAKAQRWTALTYTNPKQAAQELASTLASLSHNDLTEWERLTSVLEIFAEELSDYKPLLVYARGMRDFVHGDVKGAAKILTPVLDENNQIQVAGVNLPIPEPIRANFSRLKIAANVLRRYRSIIGYILIATVPILLTYYLLTSSLVVRPPRSITNIALDLPDTHPLYNTPRATSISQLTDVEPTDWFYEALRSLTERYGIIYPYEDNTFRPQRAITRAEMIDLQGHAFRVLYGLIQENFQVLFSDDRNKKCFIAQEPTLNRFVRPRDVKTNDWYYKSYQIINWIANYDAIDQFQGDRALTRNDMMKFSNRLWQGFENILKSAVAGCQENVEQDLKTLEEIESDLANLSSSSSHLNHGQENVLLVSANILSDSQQLAQITSINELRDMEPTVPSYEDTRSLIERYGCTVGYPDRTLRGNRTTTRAEVAAGLNACMNVIERLIQENVFVLQEDMDKIKRIIEEFRAEIDILNQRTDLSRANQKKLKQISRKIRKLESK